MEKLIRSKVYSRVSYCFLPGYKGNCDVKDNHIWITRAAVCGQILLDNFSFMWESIHAILYHSFFTALLGLLFFLYAHLPTRPAVNRVEFTVTKFPFILLPFS